MGGEVTILTDGINVGMLVITEALGSVAIGTALTSELSDGVSDSVGVTSTVGTVDADASADEGDALDTV